MSRIGKKVIEIPEKTTVSLSGNTFTVVGPMGTLSRVFKPEIVINIDEANKSITLAPKSNNGNSSALWGTYASHIMNMIAGVNKGFAKKLILEGIGYKSEVKGTNLVMSLGFSHPVTLAIPEGLKLTAEKNIITVSGIDKESVGAFAAKVRSQKLPEPYKGKGMRYENEVIKRKQGKKSA
jgi:large subunit ribosomal protein L6